MICEVTEDTATTDRRLTDEQRDLCEEHWPCVEAIAKRFLAKRPHLPSLGISLEDLISHGGVGLLEAALTYDPARSSFRTHLCTRVWGAMVDGLRGNAPKGIRTRRKDVERPAVWSLDAPSDHYDGDGKNATLADVIADDAPPPGSDMESRENFEELIRPLKATHREAMRGYYRDDVSMRIIGKTLGWCESRVSQVLSMCHDQIRERLPARNAG